MLQFQKHVEFKHYTVEKENTNGIWRKHHPTQSTEHWIGLFNRQCFPVDKITVKSSRERTNQLVWFRDCYCWRQHYSEQLWTTRRNQLSSTTLSEMVLINGFSMGRKSTFGEISTMKKPFKLVPLDVHSIFDCLFKLDVSDSEKKVIVSVKCKLLSQSTELIESKNCTLYKYVVQVCCPRWLTLNTIV